MMGISILNPNFITIIMNMIMHSLIFLVIDYLLGLNALLIEFKTWKLNLITNY